MFLLDCPETDQSRKSSNGMALLLNSSLCVYNERTAKSVQEYR